MNLCFNCFSGTVVNPRDPKERKQTYILISYSLVPNLEIGPSKKEDSK